MKKVFILVVIFVMAFSMSVLASTNQPLKNLGKGLDNIAYGEIEVPDNIDETNTKGSPVNSECTSKTNDGVGRGIARFVGGVWQVATFWYPESDSK